MQMLILKHQQFVERLMFFLRWNGSGSRRMDAVQKQSKTNLHFKQHYSEAWILCIRNSIEILMFSLSKFAYGLQILVFDFARIML